jgi:glucosamine--fructose-6-phosphate aminotransferase (isomerizing)
MRREIAEQPAVLARLFDEERPAVRALARRLRRREPYAIVIAARGSSDNAALYGRYLIETRLGIPVSLAAPSTVTLYNARLRMRGAVAIGLSQSGQSPDIVEFIRAARRSGALTVGLTNHDASPLALTAHETLRLRAGPERSIAATKTYTAQLYLLSLLVAEIGGDLDLVRGHADLPAAVERILRMEDALEETAQRWRQVNECIVTSRGYNYATAREGALKLKETCYVVAEPLSSADLLHGPIAVVERGFPVLVIAPPGRALEHLGEVLLRLRRRRAQTMVLSSDPGVVRQGTVPLPVPVSVDEVLSPHVYAAPLQLFAYHLSLVRGLDPDRPRGLRKVTRVR